MDAEMMAWWTGELTDDQRNSWYTTIEHDRDLTPELVSSLPPGRQHMWVTYRNPDTQLTTDIFALRKIPVTALQNFIWAQDGHRA